MLGLLLLLGCDGSTEPNIDRSLSGIELSQSSAGIVPEGELALYAVVRDTAGQEVERTLTWTSSDPGVAEVSMEGVVTGIAPGTAAITAAVGGKEASATIDVDRVSFTSVSAGWTNACGLTEDGAIYCWGYNIKGKVGDGTTEMRLAPVRVESSLTFRDVSMGYEHACAIASDGTAHCWGGDYPPALGNGSLELALSTVPVAGGLQFEAISAGRYHTCGLTPGGAAYCWGDNFRGQLGDGSQQESSMPVRVRADLTLRTISAGGGGGKPGQTLGHTCAVASDDRGYCWGENSQGEIGTGVAGGLYTEPLALPDTLRFEQVYASHQYSCGITTAGELLCWGRNDWGQLGRGFNSYPWAEPSIEPVLGTFRAVSLSSQFQTTCVVTDAAVGYCWGWGGLGQLGYGTTESHFEPIVLPGSLAFSQIDAGTDNGCGLTVDGVAYCWGNFPGLGVGFDYYERFGTPYAGPVPVLGQ